MLKSFIFFLLQATEVLSKLYAAHQEGRRSIGFDNEVS